MIVSIVIAVINGIKISHNYLRQKVQHLCLMKTNIVTNLHHLQWSSKSFMGVQFHDALWDLFTFST